ncbi:MAG: LPS assembly protein LptD [Acidobacteriia bacterium]|nr:LPS assembly protein LptD [Terriglobia bacterium]
MSREISRSTYLLIGVLLIPLAAASAQKPPAAKEPPPAVPPASIAKDDWFTTAITQEVEGKVYKLHGTPAEVEDSRMLFRADDIEWNKETHEVHAKGHVYFYNFERHQKIWCNELEYNTEEETGKFYTVRGETMPRIVTRPGILAVNAPFYFEGEWAERQGEKYILYKGWVTNCTLPKPWWRLRGARFDIIPGERAKAYRSTFVLRKMPLFYTPFFYHSLEREPRKSGFLIPSPGHSSLGGWTVGLGYFWAINRSYDATYRLQDFTSRAYAHHLELRGKPGERTDFDAALYGVQDRGDPNGGPHPATFSGLSVYVVGKTDLGNGWTARGALNYITSFRFRQQWSQSFNEQIGSEIHSVGFVNKDWSTFTFDAVLARLENFQTGEVPVVDPASNQPHFVTNAVTIRKLPEFELASRDRQIWQRVPLWFSFDSSAGLLYRAEPFFDKNNVLTDRFETSPFTDRLNFAPHLTGAFHWGGFHLVPSLGFQETFYSEAQAPFEDHYHATGTDIVRSARDFSLDLILPSLARVFQKKTIFGDKLKHVIEPRVTYRYVTGIGDDFNRFVRFDENDLLSNTNELAISLTNRIYAKRGDSVQEVFTWEVIQKRYFDPTFGGALVDGQRNVVASAADLTAYAFLVGPRSSSPVASRIRASPIPGLGFQWQADYDPRLHGIVDSTLSLDYRWKRYFVSAGNNEVHNNPVLTPAANQFRGRVGFGEPNHRGWNAAVDAVYDYRQGTLLYTITQVTYNTDCCGLSVQYRRSSLPGIRTDSGYSVSFAVANIGTFGTLRKQDRLF